MQLEISLLASLLSLISLSRQAVPYLTQSVAVKGVLMCGDEPAANVRVKLYDDDTVEHKSVYRHFGYENSILKAK